jgi:hypothetical protein
MAESGKYKISESKKPAFYADVVMGTKSKCFETILEEKRYSQCACIYIYIYVYIVVSVTF